MARVVQVNVDRLLPILNNTGLSVDNPPLYQFLSQLLQGFLNIDKNGTSGGSGTAGATGAIGAKGDPGLSGEDGISGEDGPPGVAGARGIQGIQGPLGPMGALFQAEDGEDGNQYPPIVGPQGNPGITGATGLIGVSFIPDEGTYGEDGVPGPAGPAGSAASVQVLLARVPLTKAQLESLNTVPIDLVAAPAANQIIVPLNLGVELVVTSGYGSTPSFSVVYNGNTTNLMSVAVAFNFNLIGSYFKTLTDGSINFTYSTFDPRGKSCQIKLSANPSGGNATAVANLVYALLTTT